MVVFGELNKQNHDITELSNILRYLLADRAICDAKTTYRLFLEYLDKVHGHLDAVDHLYQILLKDPDQNTNNIARNFMSGEQELKRIIAKYLRDWVDKRKGELVIGKDYEAFLDDTNNFFEMILGRIQKETEHLYPSVRRKTESPR
jgi:hypothetical protein